MTVIRHRTTSGLNLEKLCNVAGNPCRIRFNSNQAVFRLVPDRLQALFTHGAPWLLRVWQFFVGEIKVKLALDGADAVDAGFTVDLGMLYALGKSH